MKYDIVTQSQESTVVAKYDSNNKKESAYQTEAALEKAFIELLKAQAYEYLPLSSEAQLISNLRKQLEILNN